jgi:ribosomal protein S18 acetylase RimI-like enzyme
MVVVREFVPSASSDDSEQVVAAFLGIWNAAGSLRYLSFSMQPFDEGQVRGWFEQADSSNARYLVAVDAHGEIVGIAVLRAEPASLFEIMGIGVRADSQGRGIGGMLVTRSLELAASLGHVCVETAVFADNARMLRLLLSLDFTPVRIDHHRRADGADVVILRADLTPTDEAESASSR